MPTSCREKKNADIQAPRLTPLGASLSPPPFETCEIFPSNLEPRHPPQQRSADANLLTATRISALGVIPHTDPSPHPRSNSSSTPVNGTTKTCLKSASCRPHHCPLSISSTLQSVWTQQVLHKDLLNEWNPGGLLLPWK